MHKTAVITAPYFPPFGGGLEQYVYEVSTRLSATGAWKIVVVTSGEDPRDSVEQNGNITIHRLAYRYKVSNTPFSFGWFFKIRRIIRAAKPDVVNVHMPVPGIGDIAALFTPREKLIVTYHTGSMKKGSLVPDMAIGIYEYVFLPRLLAKANRIVCSSDFVRDSFLNRWSNKSLTVTPAVDTDVFVPDITKRSSRPTLLLVAGLGDAEQHKGLQLLLESVKVLKRRIPDIRLLIVGDGDRRKTYEDFVAKENLHEQVEFRGRCRGNDLISCYQEAHVFVLPTTNDSLPTVILEAMAAGLPVVSTNIGNIPKVVRHGVTGYVIEPNNLEQLNDAISQLITNPQEGVAFGTKGRERVVKEYGWRGRVEAYQWEFESLADNRPTIVHILAYYPPHLGGMEQRVKQLATFTANTGRRVEVITSSEGARAGTYVEDGVRVTYLRSIHVLNTPVAPGLVWRLFQTPKNSIFHIHVANAFFLEIAACIAKLRGIPYINHVRMLIIPSGIAGRILLPLYNNGVLRLVLHGARKVIVLTEDFKQEIHERYRVPYEKMTVIPNATTHLILEHSKKSVHDPVRLLAVGRLSEQKNFALLVQVAEQLAHKEQLSFTLTIVGSGSLRDSLVTQVRKAGLHDRVHFVGELHDKELEAMYAASDLFIHTALMEGFGTVLIEAMAKGLPIVAGDVLGVKSVVTNGECGILVPLTAADFSQAIMELVRNSEQYALISENNLRTVRTYDWKYILTNTFHVYDNISLCE